MKYLVRVAGRTLAVVVLGEQVSVDGQPHQAWLRPVTGTPVRLLTVDGVSRMLPVDSAAKGSWVIEEAGERYEVEVLDERTEHIRSLGGTGPAQAVPRHLKAPMPGLVIRISAVAGESVGAGASLVVLEAMKMENDLKASAPGTVEQVLVQPGQTVEKGAVLVTFRP